MVCVIVRVWSLALQYRGCYHCQYVLICRFWCLVLMIKIFYLCRIGLFDLLMLIRRIPCSPVYIFVRKYGIFYGSLTVHKIVLINLSPFWFIFPKPCAPMYFSTPLLLLLILALKLSTTMTTCV